ncbi:Alpha/beta fold hydrolase [Hyphomicrobium sp. 1Nfss2.1]|uniref:lipase family protein n=1 Tax=Hyphomicrobium sp. 1Nfss2.1 TaxID=3413936 RepID=UPI003C7BB8DA
MKRALAALLYAAVMALLPAGPAPAQDKPGLGDVGKREIANAKPGTVLRVWPQLGGSTGNAKAYRILYRSTGINGEPIAVSGAVFIPLTPLPHGKRDVVAWAHPTTGVVDRCAPTLLPDLAGTIAGLEEMLRQGYVVVATDYDGLGTEGMHPYLIGVSEARSMLDSVRAARLLPDAKASNRFAVWGHSQGGHAALFTGEEAAGYAPELKLVGVAAAAPATYLVDLFKADRGSISGNSLTAMALLSWSTIYGTPAQTALASGAHRAYEAAATSCIQTISEMLKLEQSARTLQRRFLKIDPTKTEPWRAIMLANSPGQKPAGAPVFIAQGTEDETVHPAITRRFADHLCRNGTPVLMKYLVGVSHSYAGYDGAHDAISWIADRFRGLPAPSLCKR